MTQEMTETELNIKK